MYCHIHHCHYHHCNCVPTDSTEKGGALTLEELLAYTQEMKDELKDYTVDLKDQIFSYIDVGLNPVEINNSINSLKEQDTYILRTLTNKVDELNNTTNLSMFNLRARVTALEGQSATLINDLADLEGRTTTNTTDLVDRTQRIEELETNTQVVESVSELATIENPKDGLRVHVKSYHAGLLMGGGQFFASSLPDLTENNVTVFASSDPSVFWVRTNYSEITLAMAGAIGDGVTDDTDAVTNAFKVGGAIYGNPEHTYFVTRVIVSSNPLVKSIYPNSFKDVSSNPIKFNGRGCSFKTDGFINKPQPVSIRDLITTGDGDEKKGAGIFLDGLNKPELINFRMVGSLFDNVEEDTKPYIEGVQGTFAAYNTYLCNLQLHNCTNIVLADIESDETYCGIRLAGCLVGSLTNISVSYVTRGFFFTACSYISTYNCLVNEARYGMGGTNQGTTRRELPVVNEEGVQVYKVVPNATGKEGAKAAGGISFLDIGGSYNTFTKCSSIYSASNCFRVQAYDDGGAGEIPSNNISFIDCYSDYSGRHVFSVYGKSTTPLRIIRPVVRNHGYLKLRIPAPATRAEALLGCTDGDIRNYWAFHIISSEQRLGFLCAHAGMYIEDMDYVTERERETGLGFYGYIAPYRQVRRLIQMIVTDGWEELAALNVVGGYAYSAVYQTGQNPLIIRGNPDGTPIFKEVTLDFEYVVQPGEGTTRVSLIDVPVPSYNNPLYFKDTTINLNGGGHSLALLRYRDVYSGAVEHTVKLEGVSVKTNETAFYLANTLNIKNVSAALITLDDCKLMPATDILTFGGDKTARVINRGYKYLLRPMTSIALKKDTVERVYQIPEEGTLQVVLFIDEEYPIYSYLPKGLKLVKVMPYDKLYSSFSVPVPNDYLSIINSYLYPLDVDSSTKIVKTYSADGTEGNVTLNVVSETTDEMYVNFSATNVIKGYYVFEFEGYLRDIV